MSSGAKFIVNNSNKKLQLNIDAVVQEMVTTLVKGKLITICNSYFVLNSFDLKY